MYHFFVETEQINIADKRVIIRGSDVNHIKNVLRMRPGEELSVSTGSDDREYRCGVLELSDERILCELRFIKENAVELPVRITLYQGLPKADKMELIVQKAVELGAVRIVPVAMKRCVVKLDEKKAAARVQRWQAQAEAAAKQSKRAIVPEVGAVCGFRQALEQAAQADVRLLPYELAKGMDRTRELLGAICPGQSVAILIGPEGGFDESEIALARENGAELITLGRRILRTETAGMTVLAWLGYMLEP